MRILTLSSLVCFLSIGCAGEDPGQTSGNLDEQHPTNAASGAVVEVNGETTGAFAGCQVTCRVTSSVWGATPGDGGRQCNASQVAPPALPNLAKRDTSVPY